MQRLTNETIFKQTRRKQTKAASTRNATAHKQNKSQTKQ